MPSEDYKALTLRLYATIGEVFRTGDIGLLDPLLAPDMIDHTPVGSANKRWVKSRPGTGELW